MLHRNLTIIAYQKQKLADWAFHHHLANDEVADEVAAEVAAEQLTAVVDVILMPHDYPKTF